jgi:hypothetical protein
MSAFPGPSGGGSTPGAAIIKAFSFAHDTPGLSDGSGHDFYTPAAGDVILDVFVHIVTAWDGTTPLGDLADSTYRRLDTEGAYAAISGVGSGSGGLDMTEESSAGNLAVLGRSNQLSDLRTLQAAAEGTQSSFGLYVVTGGTVDWEAGNPPANGFAAVPTVASGNPLVVWVTQDGEIGGDDPGSTQGAATIYLVTATPAS